MHKKASTSKDEVPPLAPDTLLGLYPQAPLDDFPDPVTSCQAGIQRGVTMVNWTPEVYTKISGSTFMRNDQ